MIDCFSCYLYKNIKFCEQLIWKVFYSSLAEHALVVAKWKKFIEANGGNYLNMINWKCGASEALK